MLEPSPAPSISPAPSMEGIPPREVVERLMVHEAPAPAPKEAPIPAPEVIPEEETRSAPDPRDPRWISLRNQPGLFGPALLLSGQQWHVVKEMPVPSERTQEFVVPDSLVLDDRSAWIATNGDVQRLPRRKLESFVDMFLDGPNTMAFRAKDTRAVLRVRPSYEPKGLELRDVRAQRLRGRQGSVVALEIQWSEDTTRARTLDEQQLRSRVGKRPSKTRVVLWQKYSRPRGTDHHLRVHWSSQRPEVRVTRVPAPSSDKEPPTDPVPWWTVKALSRISNALAKHAHHTAGRPPSAMVLLFKLSLANDIVFLWCDRCDFHQQRPDEMKRLRPPQFRRLRSKPSTVVGKKKKKTTVLEAPVPLLHGDVEVGVLSPRRPPDDPPNRRSPRSRRFRRRTSASAPRPAMEDIPPAESSSLVS